MFDLRGDTFLQGLIYGFISFAFAFLLFTLLNNVLSSNFFDGKPVMRKHFIYILACCFNILPFQIFNRQDRENSMRGLVYATILIVIYIFYNFSNDILG